MQQLPAAIVKPHEVAALREILGDGAFTAAWQAGQALTWQEAADDALAD